MNGKSIKCQEKDAPVNSITIIRAVNDSRQSTRALVILDTVNTYLGRYVFFNKAELPVIEPIAAFVDRFIKLKRTCPLIR